MPKANIILNPDTGDIFFVNKIISFLTEGKVLTDHVALPFFNKIAPSFFQQICDF